MKSGSLQNYKTGEIVHFKSLTAFAREHPEFGPNGIHHLYSLLTKTRRQLLGWGLPWAEEVRIVDVYGNLYTAPNPYQFCLKYKYPTKKLCFSYIFDLCLGRRPVYQYLSLESNKASFVTPGHKTYIFESEKELVKGRIYELAKFFNKDRRMIYYYLTGHSKPPQGFKFMGVEPPYRRVLVEILA